MPDLDDIAQRIVASARGDEQIEAIVVHERSTDVRAYDGAIEQLSSAESLGVGIRVIVDGRQGFAWAGTLDQAVIDETLADARDNVEFATRDEFVALASPDGVAVPTLELYSAELASVPTSRKVDYALELERATRGGDPRMLGVESADYSDSITEVAIATTTGINRSSRESSCWLSVYSLAAEGDDTTTGFGFSVGRAPSTLDVGRAARDACERATRMLGATKPGTDRLTVVLDPWVSAQLLGIIGGTLTGDAVIKGRSLFANRVGDEAFGATDFDGEGLAARRTPLISAGVLQGFLHNTYTARRMAVSSTASAVRGPKSTPSVGVHAAALTPGTRSRDELIAGIEHGVLIQEVSGLHSGVNPVSGDFSTGAEGMLIAGGALGRPVREFTIASTIQRLLHDVVAVGNDIEWFPMSAAGVTLVIRDVTMSGA
ncbi:MAG: TldD/PmbA family protein [Actinobacteria bacterium]|nr:MAG: TldD/PmbA family protein [Actinomycetota bacterium]